jgi:hypothetical protein
VLWEATMKRSVYALALGMGIAFIAGCGGDNDDDLSATDATAPVETTPLTTAIAPASTSSSDAGTSAPQATTADTSVATTEPTETTEPPPDPGDLTPAAVAAQLADEGLGCDDYADKIPEETTMTLAPAPEVEEGTCTINGVPADLGVYADEDAAEMATAQMETVYRELMVAFGVEEIAWVIAGPDDRVWVSPAGGDLGTQPKPTDEQLAMLDEVADALDGEVTTFEP